MKNLNAIIRITLGVLIFISGANKFGNWINVSFMHDALDFVTKLANIGGDFIIKGIGLLELAIGLALIVGKFSKLAILALFPLIVVILVFHLFLDLNGIYIAVLVFFMNVYLLYNLRNDLGAVLKA